ncbi:MAG: hypothetical protein ABIT96_08585 [Ferruginibacter sp.]
MEKEFYNDNFEEFLRESTEDFKMYPSRRVWHSLYNDLHPDRKWPSLAVSLLLITAILYLGVINNNAINANTNNLLAAGKEAGEVATKSTSFPGGDVELNSSASTQVRGQKSIPVKVSPSLVGASDSYLVQMQADKLRVQDLLNLNIPATAIPATVQVDRNDNVITGSPDTKNTMRTSSAFVYNNLSSAQANIQSDLNPNVAAAQTISNPGSSTTLNSLPVIENKTIDPTSGNNTNANQLTGGITSAKTVTNSLSENQIFKSTQNLDLPWVEDHAFYNRKNKGVWKAKSSLQYYITPSIGYRTIETAPSPVVTNSVVASAPATSNEVDQHAAINLEAGAALRYKIGKKLIIKGGLQINYTSYTINGYELKHPSQTTLALNNTNSSGSSLQPYNTSYANSPALSNSKLNNKTLQFSIPLGIDYQLAGNHRLKWYAGATIQPTLVTSGNAYLLSSDSKFYVNENAFINRWNINTSLETFITYKLNDGMLLQAGPQVRYQMFSTYSKQFTASEKLYNAGLKFGLIRNL